jgi:hypothetical protein
MIAETREARILLLRAGNRVLSSGTRRLRRSDVRDHCHMWLTQREDRYQRVIASGQQAAVRCNGAL